MIEKLKKFGPALLIGIGALIVYYIYKKTSTASQTSAADQAAQYAAQQQAYQAALAAAGYPTSSSAYAPVAQSVGGGTAVTQPGTSASGVPSNSPVASITMAPNPIAVPAPSTATLGANGSAPANTADQGNAPALLAQAVYNANPINQALAQTPVSSPIFQPTIQGGGSSSYLNSPGYLASQAASESAECQADPNGPACAVIKLTDPNLTGGWTPASAAYVAGNYCQQNAANNSMFGTPLDPSCSGSTPSASLLQSTSNMFGGSTGMPTDTTGSAIGTTTPTMTPPVATTTTTPILATTPGRMMGNVTLPGSTTVNVAPAGNAPIYTPVLNSILYPGITTTSIGGAQQAQQRVA